MEETPEWVANQRPMERFGGSGLPSFLLRLYSDETSKPRSGRICRTDWPSRDKTMGGYVENDQPRRRSLLLSPLSYRPKMRGCLRFGGVLQGNQCGRFAGLPCCPEDINH